MQGRDKGEGEISGLELHLHLHFVPVIELYDKNIIPMGAKSQE